jgi:hypothetical protein
MAFWGPILAATLGGLLSKVARFEAGTVHYNFGLHEIEEIK